jgi:hypothetical protein
VPARPRGSNSTASRSPVGIADPFPFQLMTENFNSMPAREGPGIVNDAQFYGGAPRLIRCVGCVAAEVSLNPSKKRHESYLVPQIHRRERKSELEAYLCTEGARRHIDGQWLVHAIDFVDDFSGKFSYAWPRGGEHGTAGDQSGTLAPLFPYGFGLTYCNRHCDPPLSRDLWQTKPLSTSRNMPASR